MARTPEAPQLVWEPYRSPSGSSIELHADGSFTLDECGTSFGPEDGCCVERAGLKITREPGVGSPIEIITAGGGRETRTLLRYEVASAAGSSGGWLRARAPDHVPQPPSGGLRERLPQRLIPDLWFQVAFGLFLVWYIFGQHQLFRTPNRSFERGTMPAEPTFPWGPQDGAYSPPVPK